jgi:hypothetical protein
MSTSEPTNGLSNPLPDRLRSPITNGDNGAASSASPITNGDNGRDRRGRFSRGNRGGPGNPFTRQLAEFRRALCRTVTEEDIECLARQLLERGRQGDVNAIKLLFVYAIGRPADAVDPDSLDSHEWQMYRQTPVHAEDVRGILNSLPPGIACAIVRTMLPPLADEVARQMVERLSPGTATSEGSEPA